jgi:hypothetical protein
MGLDSGAPKRIHRLWSAGQNPGTRYNVRFVDRLEENVHADACIENDVVNLHVLADRNKSAGSRRIFYGRFPEKRAGQDVCALAFQELRELLGISILSDGDANAIKGPRHSR